MTRAVRTIVATAFVVFIVLVPVVPAGACSCADVPMIQHLQEATAVFVGRAEGTSEGPAGLITRFLVTAVYKGASGRHVDVTTPGDEAACGVPFFEGRTYAVFAHAQGGSLTTTLCAGTTDDPASLAGMTPIARPASSSPRAAPEPRSPGASRAAPIAVAGLLVVLLSTASALAVRASRRPRPIV